MFYDPGEGVVEICAESQSVRQDIAVCFAEAGLGMNLSNKPLTFLEYDLSELQRTLRLPWVETPGFSVIQAAITELDVRPNNPLHRVSLKVTIDDDIERLAARYLGGSNILARGVLSRAMLSVRYSRAGSRQAKTLNIGVSYPNRCNLRSNPYAEKRRLGRMLLEGWGILRTSRSMSPDEERALFPMLLDLHDFNVEMMIERDLSAHGFDVPRLIELRIAEPRGRLTRMLIDEDDGDPDLVEVHEGLAGTTEYTDVTGRQAWAPGAIVRKIGVNTAYLSELILKELQGLLKRKAISVLDTNLTALGAMDLLGEAPVYLTRRLDDASVFCNLDVLLRGMDAPGAGLVLTTTRSPMRCIARNVVISLHDVLTEGSDGPVVSAEAIATLYRQRRPLALGGKTVQLLDNAFGGKTLHLPDRPELVIAGEKQVLVIERLVNAYNSGTPIVPAGALMEGMSSGSPSHVFGSRWKTIVDVYICKVGEREGWRLMA
ncbi:MAG: hypothetical protein H0T41_14185 [Rhodobacteraceae bacterium]|nr:hypothetical protein [Paracoccaceae bacterium]